MLAMNTSLFGLLLSFAIAGWSVVISAKDPSVYLNAHSLSLVLGGTVAVALLAYRPNELRNIVQVALHMFRSDRNSNELVIRQLVTIAKSPGSFGQLAKKYAGAHPFIMDGLRLIDNQFAQDEIDEIMSTMVSERKHEFQREIEIINTLAKYPPAFGMVGTVLGLVSMLGSISTESSVATIGPSMAIALATTFYGLVVSNYILSPLADCLANRLRSEMTLRRIVIKGILLIQEKQDAVFIEESLNAFVLPKQRVSLTSETRMAA
jgi:chemotaxis protein MotA